ncbi:hypothetical protein MCOR27_010477 [Pyricularia oryzae]|uniref:Cytochrome P450 n=1 Tax=Pyricularia grisea TaxID=148305 RepID=A0ABQ8N6Y8_PYRGI|nr:hypothetical protein MCOR01_008342 [Pyricularia oryzae]KAI6292303.1 hypothetical protein MCOR33_009958 [Pyricularia grisea]KAH9438956.1 hypothetical protein MCOR02_002542 [Pyricularia oryzae]KAI6253255.1 hypothetical protein MCOR19_010188 [Pyricularia oryzae]KAI6267720.1 hypothetical protein MCOR27_010477 [Pyricularia oryzae]
MTQWELVFGMLAEWQLEILVTITVLIAGSLLYLDRPAVYPGIPLMGAGKGWFGYRQAVNKYRVNGREMVREYSKTNKPFQVITDTTTKIFLPAEYTEEVKGIKELSFGKGLSIELFGGYRGFEAVAALGDDESNIIQTVSRLKITTSLKYLTDEISDEASAALQEQLGDNIQEWQEASVKPIVRNLNARLSARVFVGPELCRNKAWLDVSTSYAAQCGVAAFKLQAWPRVLQWPVSLFLPECRVLRRMAADARRILAPIASNRSDKPVDPKHRGGDTILWIQEAVSKAKMSHKYSVADFQLGLSLAAIHTTTELLTNALFDIVTTGPELIDELRREIIQVFNGEGGIASYNEEEVFTKERLYKLRLLDSTLKETQRLRMSRLGGMPRVATAPITFKSGLAIPAGAFTHVLLTAHMDPSIYSSPETYDPRRFLRLRSQPGQDKNWQMVTTSPHHLAFGYGEHACPGRFLAAAQVKIALVRLLMEYDWRFDGGRPESLDVGGGMNWANPNAKVSFRKRKAEVAF